MPAITKTQLYKIEDRFRTDDGGVNRRVLLSSLSVHLDNLKGWEPEWLLDVFTCAVNYVERRQDFTRLMVSGCSRMALALEDQELSEEQRAEFDEAFTNLQESLDW